MCQGLFAALVHVNPRELTFCAGRGAPMRYVSACKNNDGRSRWCTHQKKRAPGGALIVKRQNTDHFILQVEMPNGR